MGLLLKVKKDKMDQWEGFSCLCYTVNQETDIVEYARRKFLVLYLGVLMEQFIQPSYWEKERKSQWQKEETKGINLSLLRRKFLSVSYLWLSVEQELIVGRRKGQEFQSKNSKKKKKKSGKGLFTVSSRLPPKRVCTILLAFIRKQEKQVTKEEMCCGNVTENMVWTSGPVRLVSLSQFSEKMF